jgi:hypothetical protein
MQRAALFQVYDLARGRTAGGREAETFAIAPRSVAVSSTHGVSLALVPLPEMILDRNY